MDENQIPADGSQAELIGEWPPCPKCNATRRKAVATLAHPKIAVVCMGPCQGTLLWERDDGQTGQWIPHDVLLPGGQHEHTIARHFLSNANTKSQNPDRKFDINVRRLDWIKKEQRACAQGQCGKPPLRDTYNGRAVVAWLKEHHHDLYDRLEAFAKVRRPKLQFTDWRLVLACENQDLLIDITSRVKDANLQADRGVPVYVLKAVWSDWTPKMRNLATSTLAFGLCRPCNVGQSKFLPSNAELLRRHIELNHEGSERRAMADTMHWKTLDEVLGALNRYRATLRRERDDPGVAR